MDSTVIILIMMAAMMVILIVFAFILVMGGADSAPADDGTVVIRVDKEHAQEVADIFRDLLCDRFEYNANHERQRDADIVSDVLNLTPPPQNGPGRQLFKKIVAYNDLDQKEKLSLLSELELHGIPIDLTKLEGDREEEMMPEDENAGVTHASSLEEFDAAAGQTEEEEKDDEPKNSGVPEPESATEEPKEEPTKEPEEEPSAKKDRKPEPPKNKKPRVKPVRTAESDKKKKMGSGDHSVSSTTESFLDDSDFGAKEFNVESI